MNGNLKNKYTAKLVPGRSGSKRDKISNRYEKTAAKGENESVTFRDSPIIRGTKNARYSSVF
jgi:hypothetical protein